MDCTSAGWLVVAPVGFHASPFAVHVPRPSPIREAVMRTVFIAPLRHRIENPVNPEELLSPAAESRIGMEDLAGLVLKKDAVAREIFHFCRPFGCFLVIVESATGSTLLAHSLDTE